MHSFLEYPIEIILKWIHKLLAWIYIMLLYRETLQYRVLLSLARVWVLHLLLLRGLWVHRVRIQFMPTANRELYRVYSVVAQFIYENADVAVWNYYIIPQFICRISRILISNRFKLKKKGFRLACSHCTLLQSFETYIYEIMK